jgi:hypothetical protein
MLHQSSTFSMELSGSFSMENGAAAFFRANDAQGDGLRDHLIHDHGRTEQELDGLPLAELHHFEHVEQGMGLNDLGHHHPAQDALSPGIL